MKRTGHSIPDFLTGQVISFLSQSLNSSFKSCAFQTLRRKWQLESSQMLPYRLSADHFPLSLFFHFFFSILVFG